MAKLHHAPVSANTLKLKTDNNTQRTIRAADRHSFEHALKFVKSEKLEKHGNVSGSNTAMEQALNVEAQEDWRLSRNTVVADGGLFQSTHYAGSTEPNTQSIFASGLHRVQDFHIHHDFESALCPKQLSEMGDWLDELIDQDQDRSGGWAFEFETNDAEVVEMRLSCHKDGQWSACVSMDVSANDQQQLDAVLRQRGVALSWADFS